MTGPISVSGTKLAQGETKTGKSETIPPVSGGRKIQGKIKSRPGEKVLPPPIKGHANLFTLADLKEDPDNPREMDADHLAGLQVSMLEFGDLSGIVFNLRTGQLVCGHQRIQGIGAKATKDHPIETDGAGSYWIEFKGKRFPIRLVDWDQDTQQAANIAANSPHIAGRFSKNLQPQLDAIRARGLELFKGLRFHKLDAARKAGQTDPDAVPAAPKKTKAMPGDLYLMGEHRLLCGDSTKLDSLTRLMEGQKAQLCFTSPPYWVGKAYETQTSLDEIQEFIRQITATIVHAVTKDGGRVVINTSTAMATAINPKADAETLFALAWWQDALREHSWLMRHCRLWVKRGQLAAPRVAARSDVVDQHWEKVATFLPTFYNPEGLRRGQQKIGMTWAQQGVWDDIHGAANMEEHGAAFPVELPLRYIQLYSVEAESIFEPFCGTGTTIIAAEQLGRRCYALEMDPRNVDISVQRWEDFTGRKAKRVR